MELTNETPIEQVETEEQKSKRRVAKYYLVFEKVGDSTQAQLAEFSTKKELKEFLEQTESIENLNPVLILGHEVPLTFNKIVKVDF